jgi:hypothetical protein
MAQKIEDIVKAAVAAALAGVQPQVSTAKVKTLKLGAVHFVKIADGQESTATLADFKSGAAGVYATVAGYNRKVRADVFASIAASLK